MRTLQNKWSVFSLALRNYRNMPKWHFEIIGICQNGTLYLKAYAKYYKKSWKNPVFAFLNNHNVAYFYKKNQFLSCKNAKNRLKYRWKFKMFE